MVVFAIVHILLVVVEDFPRNMAWIIHGQYSLERVAVWVGLAGLVVVLALHVWATDRQPPASSLGAAMARPGIEPVRRVLLHHATSRQHYPKDEVSGFFRVNGYPPTSPAYQRLAEGAFSQWRLSVGGLVEKPLELSLADLRALPRQTQVTKHHCIQGWSAVGEWTGVAVAEVLDRCLPLASARYLVFRGFDEPDGREYYETIDLELARHPQTILAYEMNGATLPIPHGAPCRLRVETQLGFKMVKYLRSIELIQDYRQLGDGQGGFREDTQFYGTEAGI